MITLRKLLTSVLWVAAVAGLSNRAATIIPTGADWRYAKGRAEASAPVDAWRTAGFADSSWTTGSAPFFYGENLAGGTLLTDMLNQYSSIFLRKGFQIQNASLVSDLKLRAICDDGFIAWINGVEVARYNMPAGARAYNSFASASVTEPIAFADYPLPAPTYLNSGANVLAIQVFNSSLSSSDLQFDAELTSSVADTEAPTVVRIDPPPSTLEGLTQVTVTFSEAVTGVSPSYLILGGQEAVTVTGSGSLYVFTFNDPGPGEFDLRWDTDTLITDLASPGNRFDPAIPVLHYVLRDTTAPRVLDVLPKPGTTLKTLGEVQIRFTETVLGLRASDLLLNGKPATNLLGTLAGPYRFQFDPPTDGPAAITWAPGIAVRDQAGNVYQPDSWSVQVDSNYRPPSVQITEILASNRATTGLKDEDGTLQDWIELYNTSDTAVNLEEWTLSNDSHDPDRWAFPRTILNPKQYLVVFASGKDRKPTNGVSRLHTNFKLNPFGAYLGLFDAQAPRSTIYEFSPEFPEQRNDYSYGTDSNGQRRYFRTPTPGAPNSVSDIDGVVTPPLASVERGWFEQPFDVEITSAELGVAVLYTLDGSEPTVSNGLSYSGPLRITGSTVLRFIGIKTGKLPSTSVTHSYLFYESVLKQPNNPPGFPVGSTVMAGYPSDYEMDPELVNSSTYGSRLLPALKALPVVSIAIKVDDMFGAANGIYTHPLTRGPAWERPCSMEFFALPAGKKGFQVNAGIQIQGNAAREPIKQPKHPMRVVFKGSYGPSTLKYQMFPDSPIDEFDTLILRADFNFSWLHWDPNQRIRAQRTRDAWMKDTMRSMGNLASHNRYVHLFINGLYWGIYEPAERPDGSYGAAYLGGQKEDYDVINEGAAVDGTMTAYNAMLAISNLADPANYARMWQYLDKTQFIDYMLLHFYVAHEDWGQNKNWYTVRPKNGSRGFYYVPWDGEMILNNVNGNRVSSTDTPSGLHTKLLASAEYKLAFADRVQKHLFNTGALTPAPASSRWTNRSAQVDLAIVAESVRWGDYRRDVHQYQSGPYDLYTRDNQWMAEQTRLLTDYFPRRTAIFLSQLRTAGLYPAVTAPSYSQQGGAVPSGFALSATSPDGSIYYTTDGTDPRTAFTGAISSTSALYQRPLVLTNSVRIKSRTLRQNVWSALNEAEFQVDQTKLPLVITEINYHPIGGNAYEFIEIANLGSVPIDVGGFSLRGLNFLFPHGSTIGPREAGVIASDVSRGSFVARYPNVTVLAWFNGSLDNGSETLELIDREGQILSAVKYNDSDPWPKAADGAGATLEFVNLAGDPQDPANWQASEQLHGSPGSYLVILKPKAPVLSATLQGRSVLLQFQTQPNQGCKLEFKFALSETTWRTMTNFPAEPAAQVRNIQIDAAAATSSFYRVSF